MSAENSTEMNSLLQRLEEHYKDRPIPVVPERSPEMNAAGYNVIEDDIDPTTSFFVLKRRMFDTDI